MYQLQRAAGSPIAEASAKGCTKFAYSSLLSPWWPSLRLRPLGLHHLGQRVLGTMVIDRAEANQNVPTPCIHAQTIANQTCPPSQRLCICATPLLLLNASVCDAHEAGQQLAVMLVRSLAGIPGHPCTYTFKASQLHATKARYVTGSLHQVE